MFDDVSFVSDQQVRFGQFSNRIRSVITDSLVLHRPYFRVCGRRFGCRAFPPAVHDGGNILTIVSSYRERKEEVKEKEKKYERRHYKQQDLFLDCI